MVFIIPHNNFNLQIIQFQKKFIDYLCTINFLNDNKNFNKSQIIFIRKIPVYIDISNLEDEILKSLNKKNINIINEISSIIQTVQIDKPVFDENEFQFYSNVTITLNDNSNIFSKLELINILNSDKKDDKIDTIKNPLEIEKINSFIKNESTLFPMDIKTFQIAKIIDSSNLYSKNVECLQIEDFKWKSLK